MKATKLDNKKNDREDILHHNDIFIIYTKLL